MRLSSRMLLLLLLSPAVATGLFVPCVAHGEPRAAAECYLAPIAVAPCGERQLAVLGSTGRRLLIIETSQGKLLSTIRLSAEASGMAIRGRTAYVTTNEPAGRLLQIDMDRNRVQRAWRVGHAPTAPLLSVDGGTVYLANRFENQVRSVHLATGVQRCVGVIREPVAMVLGADGKHLFVANHLPCVRPFLDDENPTIHAEVSVIDVERMEPAGTIELPNGSQGLRGIALSPCGDYVAVTHVLSNFVVPTMEVAGGAMNRNALSLVRTDSLDPLATLILDGPDCGAANPWAVCFTDHGKSLLVSHAGTHEISVITCITAILCRSKKPSPPTTTCGCGETPGISTRRNSMICWSTFGRFERALRISGEGARFQARLLRGGALTRRRACPDRP